MTQDKASQPTIEEATQSSDQTSAILVTPVSEQISDEIPLAEIVTEENEEQVADAEDEEEETEDASSEEMTEAETTSPDDSADSAPSNTTQSTATTQVEKDERTEIEKQPYAFDHCTVQVAIQLLPDDGDANGRLVVVGVRSHLDAPLLRMIRLNQIGTLPPLVIELLDALKAELPAREQTAREAFEKKKAEKAKRQTTVTTSKTARGKKAKPTLATTPASSNATTDNRPRPEAKVSGAPQQQMGLF